MKIVDINDSERECLSAIPDPSYPGFMKIQFRSHHEWYSIQEFLQKNPTMTNLTSSAPPSPDDALGVVTSATEDSARDTKQRWIPNVYMGYKIWISRGKGEGQLRLVLSNTEDTVKVDRPWDSKPNTTSQYVIAHEIHATHRMGNTLPQVDQKNLEKLAKKMHKKYGIPMRAKTVTAKSASSRAVKTPSATPTRISSAKRPRSAKMAS